MKRMTKILVVEDAIICQLGIKALLEENNCQYKIVDTGEDAITIADQYDLILMDIGLPGISGIEATVAIRKKGITTPIIALTAHGTEKDKKQYLEAGMNDFINKPLTTDNLEELLRTYIKSPISLE